MGVPLAESALPASHSEESADRMGIEYSTEDHEDVPLTGSPTSLEVLRGSGKYIKKDTVILKLRENGSNYRIDDTSGEKYFSIIPTDLMDDSMKLVDAKGKEIANFRKERFGAGKRAHITVKNNGLWSKKSEGKVLAVATLDHGSEQAGNNCQIYIHSPPISVDEFNINNMKPDIIVEGDVMLKEYQFIVEEREGKLLKIGRAVHDLSELNSEENDPESLSTGVYYLQVGRNIDLAFLVLCAHAMDMMFWDTDYLSD